MGITLSEAKALCHGDILYHWKHTNADGRPCRFRVASKIKTWKTRPDLVEFTVRYGMEKTTHRIDETDLHLFFLKEWRATGTKISFKKVDGPRFQYYNVIFGKQKIPYKKKYEDRKIGNVFRDRPKGKYWFNNQERYQYKTRREAAEGLLDKMLD